MINQINRDKEYYEERFDDRAYELNGGDMLELVRYQKRDLQKAAGAEYNVLSSTQMIQTERAVSIYEIDEAVAFSECSILRFDEPNEAWLDFVSDNRSGNYEGESYDFIFGSVANDDVYRTFTLYTAGVLTKEQTLDQLKIKKLYNQLVLTSEKALSYLQFVGTVPEEEF